MRERDKNKLLKFGIPLGSDVKRLISIVRYETFRKWIRDKNYPKTKNHNTKRGRPRKITLKIKELIVHMAKHNKWGYTKILGELRKLAIIKTSKTTVKNILKEYGIDPLKYRSEDTWDDYLKRTFETLWACDFFTKSIWTPMGRRMYYILFFINIKSRKVHIAGITRHPNNKWITEQLELLAPQFKESTEKTALIRDRDTKFSKDFDNFFKKQNINVLKIPYRSPNLNPYAESWVATIKREYLNHFLVLGKVHLEFLVKEFEKYYNQYRPHSSLDNNTIEEQPVKLDGEICTKPMLGGLTHHYFRK